MGRRSSKRTALFFVALVASAGAAYAAWREGYLPGATQSPASTPPVSAGTLRVHYLDVGQGDGTVWQLPDGGFVVYDCGPPVGFADQNAVVRKLRELNATRVRALVASHGHLDHIGGCEEILAEFQVDHLYEAWYDGADRPESYKRFQLQLQGEGGSLHTLATMKAGDLIDLGTNDARATLLWPAALSVTRWDNIAQASLVVRLVHGSSSFCFQGDIEEAQEKALAARADDLSCDVYLAGHHGSRHASTTEWLAKMRPAHAVVSFGENSFGHPTSEALCRIQTAGAQAYATRGAGVLVATSDGSSVTLTGSPESKDYCAVGAGYWS